MIAADGSHRTFKQPIEIDAPKMIHDIPVSLRHTIILDLPLTFSPFGIVRGKPMLHFDRTLPSRFGVIPRLFDGDQDAIRWFVKPEPCMIFHCANTWDEIGDDGETIAVRMLACQFRTSALAYGAGGLEPPPSEIMPDGEADIVRLTFHRFELATTTISHEIVLSEVPFEFPVVAGHVAMQDARYVYGLSLRTGSFDAGRGAKPDCLVKMDVRTLIERGMADKLDVVDGRSIGEIIAADDATDSIRVFALPPGVIAQEPAFVPRRDAQSEDDGFLLLYTYDEAQLDAKGRAADDTQSELWILDARTLTVIATIRLPQRVPYGLHAAWVTEDEIASQRPDLVADPVVRPSLSRAGSAAKIASKADAVLAVPRFDAFAILMALGLFSQAFIAVAASSLLRA